MLSIYEAQEEAKDIQSELARLRQECTDRGREPDDDEVQQVEAHLARIKWLRKYIKKRYREERVVDGRMDDNDTGGDDHMTRSRNPYFEQHIEATHEKKRKWGLWLQAVAQRGGVGGLVDEAEFRSSGLEELVPSSGGFLVPTDFANTILSRVYESPVASRCWKTSLTGPGNQVEFPAVDETSRADGSRYGGVQVYWQAEGTTGQDTKPKFRKITLKPKKLIGLAYITDEMLADSNLLQDYVVKVFTEEVSFKIDDAIINGSGAGLPMGIMNSPATIAVTRAGAGNDIDHADVVAMWSRLWSRSRTSACWLINQDVEVDLHSMTIATGTNSGACVYLPPGGISNAPYASLMGRPVFAVEQCQTKGTSGDIILCDMSQYLLVDKGSPQTAWSAHVKFTTDEMAFRVTYRADGCPWWNNTLTPFKGSNTQSPFVTLADA